MNYENKLRNLLSKLPHKKQVRFALDCALECKHLLTDSRSRKALEITALWLEDKATEQEIKAASRSAYNATSINDYANHAAADTMYSAVDTYSSGNAAYAAAKALKLPLEHYYTKLVNSLTEVEKAIYEL